MLLSKQLVLPSDVLTGVTLCPGSKLMVYLEVVTQEALSQDALRRMRPSNTYKPQAWRWLKDKQDVNKSLAKVIDKEEAFCFRP